MIKDAGGLTGGRVTTQQTTLSQWAELVTPSGAPFGTCHPSECKQQFSVAYTYAIAAAARCTISKLVSDVEKIDYTVRQVANHSQYTTSQIDVQMKCTEQDVLRDDGIHWRLSRED